MWRSFIHPSDDHLCGTSARSRCRMPWFSAMTIASTRTAFGGSPGCFPLHNECMRGMKPRQRRAPWHENAPSAVERPYKMPAPRSRPKVKDPHMAWCYLPKPSCSTPIGHGWDACTITKWHVMDLPWHASMKLENEIYDRIMRSCATLVNCAALIRTPS